METMKTDAVVIGAGVVGLAIARVLAQSGLETIILEKNATIGMETSARNSEVIHAGIYYLQDTLKARLCVRGKHLLYDFCRSHGVAFTPLGKLIVGQAGQDPALASIHQAAQANGVDDLRPLSQRQIADLEPDLRAAAGLFSPSTGIIDSHAYMLALLGDAENAGAALVQDASVTAITPTGNGYRLHLRNAGEEITLNARIVVNAAGLWAQSVAHATEGLDSKFVPPLFLAKGSYAALLGKSPFRHLVYPMPEPGGLGVHLTLDMGGQARFGPDVEWLADKNPAAIDYTVSPDVGMRFAVHIQAYWPGVTADRLTPAYSGVRPKLSGPGEPAADFRIDGPQRHGLPGLVNLFGIESPGLTASLAIAEHVRTLLD
jgi:L-2-hydroxyglutarate oxidase LhgO